MAGHGRPHNWLLGILLAEALSALIFYGTALAQQPQQNVTMRVRIAWGGGRPKDWHGKLVLPRGTLQALTPLGLEADEPGSIRVGFGVPDSSSLPGGQLPNQAELAEAASVWFVQINQRSPRSYDGVDVTVVAPPDAKILYRLSAGTSPPSDNQWQFVSLEQLLEGPISYPLDNEGNRIVFQWLKHSAIQVRVGDRPLVFRPGEKLRVEVLPNLPNVEPGKRLTLICRLSPARATHVLWQQKYDLLTGQNIPLTVELEAPAQEGAYELSLLVFPQRMIPLPELPDLAQLPPLEMPTLDTLPSGVLRRQPIAERHTQFVVVADQQENIPAEELSWRLVDQFDPTEPGWWQRLANFPAPVHWVKLPKFTEKPLSNDKARTWIQGDAKAIELPPCQRSDEPAWQAYALSIKDPGRPHLVEVELRGPDKQVLTLAILEPDEAGAVIPPTLSITSVTGQFPLQQLVQSDRVLRLLFWPRTRRPLLLLANPSDKHPARFGKIRVFSGPEQLPSAFARSNPNGRLLLAYFDRPLLPERFLATQSLDKPTNMAIDDWQTFFEASDRLIRYLEYRGYGGAAICVWAEGSTIYPSHLLEPTPRFDTGTFDHRGGDPVRKDVLEVLFRMFDREGLKLICAVEFSSPLPALELSAAKDDGIALVGKDGKTWAENHRPFRGMAPYYNVLDPRVQQAMLDVCRELVERYGRHPAFGGLMINFSAFGYSQLPGVSWPLDDRTVARFSNHTGIQLPNQGPDRFEHRAELLGGKYRTQWLQWRAQQLHQFYRQVAQIVSQVRPDAKLYLNTVRLFDSPRWQAVLGPTLDQPASVQQLLLEAGLDAELLSQSDEIVLLKPGEVSLENTVGRWTPELLGYRSIFSDEEASGRVVGVLFYHRNLEMQLPSFDRECPFRQCFAWFPAEISPIGLEARQRFVRALAETDAHLIIDGGLMCAIPEDEWLRRFAATYARLPFAPLARLQDESGNNPADPVVIRTGHFGGSTYICLINTAPFTVNFTCRLVGNNPFWNIQLEELSGLREIQQPALLDQGATWTVTLEPLDVLAVRASEEQVRIQSPKASWPTDVDKKLAELLGSLRSRIAVLRDPPLWNVLPDAGFEQSSPNNLIGWTVFTQAGGWAGPDDKKARSGKKSLRLASTGPVVSVVSEPFLPPETGRLAVRAWFCTDGQKQPLVRMALEARFRDGHVVSLAEKYLGSADNAGVVSIDSNWNTYADLHVPAIALTQVSALRVRFDLLGAGQVWIDDVQLCQLAFSRTELVALMKLIAPAEANLQARRPSACLELLENYWCRFLLEHVQLPQGMIASQSDSPFQQVQAPRVSGDVRERKPPEKTAGWFDKLRSWLPNPMKLF